MDSTSAPDPARARRTGRSGPELHVDELPVGARRPANVPPRLDEAASLVDRDRPGVEGCDGKRDADVAVRPPDEVDPRPGEALAQTAAAQIRPQSEADRRGPRALLELDEPDQAASPSAA